MTAENAPKPAPTVSHLPTVDAHARVHCALELAWETAQKVFGEIATPQHALAIADMVLVAVESEVRAGRSLDLKDVFKDVVDKIVERVPTLPFVPSANPPPPPVYLDERDLAR